MATRERGTGKLSQNAKQDRNYYVQLTLFNFLSNLKVANKRVIVFGEQHIINDAEGYSGVRANIYSPDR